jgi:hypothetical protein
MRENRHLYKIYVDIAHMGYSIKERRVKGRYDEEYFDSKLKQ